MTPTLSNDSAEQLILRIGNLTRMLRDNMRELGLDKEIERAAQAIPDARDRLNYIAAMTEQAAERTLNACNPVPGRVLPITGGNPKPSQHEHERARNQR